MQIEKYKVDELNQQQLSKHKSQFEFVAADVPQLDDVMKKLMAFNVAIPSWALGTGGTRFGRFSGGGEPGNLEEKIEDVGVIHALNRSSGAISLHIPWDIPKIPPPIKPLRAGSGLPSNAWN